MKSVHCLPALIYTSLGLLILLLSAGCSALTLPDLPTPYPTEYLPTVLAMTVEAGRQARTASALPPTPTLTVTLEPTTASPTATKNLDSTQPVSIPKHTTAVTPTSTLIPTKSAIIAATPSIPKAEISISKPGAMSKVVSPLGINVTYHSVPSGYLLVELIAEPLQAGQGGRLLFSELQRFASGEPFWGIYSQELEFEIGRVSEFAVLRFSIFDTFDRPVAVSSVDLLLLQVGSNEINPPGSPLQAIAIHEPTENKLIQGGLLTVSGLTNPEGDQYLHFELVRHDKAVFGTHDLVTVPALDGKHIPFSAKVEYTVSKATWVSLIVYYLDPRILGYRELTSVPILLSP